LGFSVLSGVPIGKSFIENPKLSIPNAVFQSLATLPVAGFKAHITGSTIVGAVYGYWGVVHQGMSIESGLLAAGLCSVSGMLPDLDSDSGVPLRETSMFASATVPMLMIERFRDLNLSHETMALAAMVIYIGIRFVIVEFFRRYTVHRGMWHSIPAAASCGVLAYLIMPCPAESVRVYKSIAVVLGFTVHLVMDEIWSLDFRHGRFRLKKSFGTALKFWGDSAWANLTVYAKLALLMYLAWGDKDMPNRIRERARAEIPYLAAPRDEPPAWQKWLQRR
jgi:LexA-binding, inner membrane-associated putative hydrolase